MRFNGVSFTKNNHSIYPLKQSIILSSHFVTGVLNWAGFCVSIATFNSVLAVSRFDFNIKFLFWFPIFWPWAYPMKVIYRHASCVLNYIYNLLKLSRGLYLCWWTNSHREYHPPVVRVSALTWFGRYFYFWNLNVIIVKIKVFLPKT